MAARDRRFSPITIFLVPRLCLGTQCLRGSASLSPEQAEPARQSVPRRSLGTRKNPSPILVGKTGASRPSGDPVGEIGVSRDSLASVSVDGDAHGVALYPPDHGPRGGRLSSGKASVAPDLPARRTVAGQPAAHRPLPGRPSQRGRC